MQFSYGVMRVAHVVGVVLLGLLPSASACSWSSWPMEGRWGLWSTATGEIEIVESPMFSHGTACEPYPPGHALEGDLFVWAEPVWSNTSASRIHVHRAGKEVAVWPVPNRGPWRGVEHLGVEEGVAYLVWEERGNETPGPVGRIDLSTGAYSEIPNPFPETDTFWLRVGGSVLWSVGWNSDSIWAYDLAAHDWLARNLTADRAGAPGPGWAIRVQHGGAWAVFADDASPADHVRFWAKNLETGHLAAFELPDVPWSVSVSSRYLYAWGEAAYGERSLHKVDLLASPPAVEEVRLPPVLHDVRSTGLGSVKGDVVTVAWLEAADVEQDTFATKASAAAPAVFLGIACLVAAALRGHRQR